MPKIQEILHYEAEKQSNEVVLFLEGNFGRLTKNRRTY